MRNADRVDLARGVSAVPMVVTDARGALNIPRSSPAINSSQQRWYTDYGSVVYRYGIAASGENRA